VYAIERMGVCYRANGCVLLSEWVCAIERMGVCYLMLCRGAIESWLSGCMFVSWQWQDKVTWIEKVHVVAGCEEQRLLAGDYSEVVKTLLLLATDTMVRVRCAAVCAIRFLACGLAQVGSPRLRCLSWGYVSEGLCV